MSPHEIPFVRLLLPFLAGIASGAAVDLPLRGGWIALALGALGLVVWSVRKQSYRFRWAYGAGLAGWLFLAGYCSVVERDERRLPHHFSRVCPTATVWVGVVCDVPDKGAKLKVPLRIWAAREEAGGWKPCEGYLLLFLDHTGQADSLRYGDRLWVSARALPVEPPKNPDAFDYRRYLHYRNIHYQAFVRDGEFGLIDRGHGNPLWRMAYGWRERLLTMLRDYFPTRDEYAVASALLLGYKEDLSEELRTTYTQTGSMHALAVSGTHVGLVYAALYFLIRRLPWPQRYKRWGDALLLLLGIWSFALVTGATPSVLRAALMFTLFLIGKTLHRHASTWNILGATAFLLLLYNPYYLFDLGFQLSFVAVAGIVGLYPLFNRYSPELPKGLKGPWDVLLIGVAAQVGTLPLSLYYFHQFPVYFWLAGWVVVLGGAIYLWGAGALIALHLLVPPVADALGWGLYYVLLGMNTLMRFIQHLPGSVVQGVWISGWAAVCLYVSIAYGAASLWHHRPRWAVVALAALLCVAVDRLVRQVGQLYREHLVVYAAGRHWLVDFFSGPNAYSWSDGISERRERMIAEAHRWSSGVVHPPVRVDARFDRPFRSANLWVQPPFVQFSNSLLAVVDSPLLPANADRPPVAVEALILHNNPRVTVEECLRHFQPKVVVIGASNREWRAQRWRAECERLQLSVHDVRQQGAWLFDAKP